MFKLIGKQFFGISIVVFAVLFIVMPTRAQDNKITLTITPPLIKNNLNPGDTWAGSIKVVNNNTRDIDVYTDVYDFKSGKNGGVEFLLNQNEVFIDDNVDWFLLSQWIRIEPGPIKIKASQSTEIPFSITVPKEAEPGGHYAAILVGTKPGMGNINGTGIGVSSKLSSLIMVTIGGDVEERAKIREFSTDKTVYKDLDVNFTLKFQNIGNVHVQPIGEIDIYNMFGKKVGKIDINYNSSFGNVLPDSTREWTFKWSKPRKLFDFGRYKARIFLTYGEKSKATDTRALYFWVLDFKLLGMVIGAILFIILFFFIVLKLYIRSVVKKAQKELGITKLETKLKADKHKKVENKVVLDLKNINNEDD